MRDVLFYQNYNVAGDVIAISICVLYRIMLRTTYTVKHKNLTIFNMGNALVILAAFSHILFHHFIDRLSSEYVLLIYILRDMAYITIVLTYALFCIYVRNLVSLGGWRKKVLNSFIWGAFILFVAAEISAPFTKWGFYISKDLLVHQNYYLDPFRFIYLLYGLIIVIMFLTYRKKLTSRMFNCIISSMLIAFVLMAIQDHFCQTTFTNITFTFPIMTILFLFHYNSYDAETGTLDSRSFNGYIKDLGNKKFSLICLYLQELNERKMHDMSEHFFHFCENSFKNSCTFHMRDDKLVLVYQDDKNKDACEKIPVLLEEFRQLYVKYKMDYRIVIIQCNPKIITGSEYLALNDFIDGRIAMNSVHLCDEKDVDDFLEHRYILTQLRDIHMKRNLDDPRIRVYCQPVYNIRTNQYTSAEALMRIVLPECGMIFPEQFIPLAEKHEYIHTLSLIILNKTCQQIRSLAEQGFRIDHVSVNFSILELRDKNFCEDILRIIQQNRIPYDKIALELTESRNESDFEKVKNVMVRLHHLGIKFYLDDFGTGYSNFVRIIGLPIDIIKFDRSLTILASKDEESRFLVGSFSEIFKQSHYQILFEGVEDEREEAQCISMNALYLQGYKYSRPIPMGELTKFFERVG